MTQKKGPLVGAGIFLYVLMSCSLFVNPLSEESAKVNGLDLVPDKLSLNVGSVEFLTLSVLPSAAAESAEVTYTYDESIISVDGDNYGAVLTGLKSGNTVIKAEAGGRSAACVVTVSGVDPSIENAPVITTTTPVVELEAGVNKKAMVSLTNGNAADMAAFSWSIDKSTIANVDAAGQNAIISGKGNGIARITVTHPEASYPLHVLVFVKPTDEKPVYITTTQNIITMGHNDPEKTIKVSLVNGNESQEAFFDWTILDNSQSDPSCVTLTENGANAVLSPKSGGEATLRVSHPEALYSLDIHIRIKTIVEHVYIQPSTNKVLISGDNTAQVHASLAGAVGSEQLDVSQFVWSLDTEEFCTMNAYADSVVLSGKHNGIAKITVSHPSARYPREIVVVVRDQVNGAIDGSMYITTSQNYLRTKVGQEDIDLSVSLVGGVPGDEANFVWTVGNTSIISVSTTHGEVGSRSLSSFQHTTMTGGHAYINAISEGTTTITITHPKIVVPTEILVKVLPEYAVLESPAYITAPSILGIVQGTEKNVSASLYGDTVVPGHLNQMIWSSQNEGIATVMSNGPEAVISASGIGTTNVVVEHPMADNPKNILVYTAENQTALDAFRLIYSEKTFYTVLQGAEDTLVLSTLNILDAEIAEIEWSVDDDSVVQLYAGATNMEARIIGLSPGHTMANANLDGVGDVRFSITVYPEGTDTSVLPSPVYFTTSRNVIQFSQTNTSQTAYVTAVGMDNSKYHEITWTADDENIVEVIDNGVTATIHAKEEGVARITVSHPESENTLIITVRVGERYIIVNPNTPYIITTRDVISIPEGSPGVQINAELYNSELNQGFTWDIDEPGVATISPLDATCFVIPRSLGQARITISHPDAEYDKTLLVLVQNSAEDIADIPYLTTSQNMVNLRTGSQQNVGVKILNSDQTPTGYSWTSDNPSILQIIASGQQATFKALVPGITRVSVEHTECKYPIEIVVTITDQTSDAADNPYITSGQNIITVTEGGGAKNLSVILAGGTEPDLQHFQWNVDRPDVVKLTANAHNAVVRGIAPGEARITVTHPKAVYPFTITAITEAAAPDTNLYINTSRSILTMKPADEEQSVTAALVGGSAEDKYGFTWYADNYNVIDLTYSANMAVIAPKQEGTAVITVTHPKAAYDATITVRVTEYSTFAFAQPSMTITEGTTQFVSMQVPAMEGGYAGRVIYSTDNHQIVTITGTNKVAQVTAVGPGTAVVTATSPSGATSDMMVYVKRSAEETLPYITSTVNVISMKATDNQRSVTAALVGQDVIQTDQYNLHWYVESPGIIELIGTTGPNILVRPVAGGETTIRITHPKTETIFSIWVRVESLNNGLSLDRNYLSLETGKTAEITATIENGTADQYRNIVWSTDKVNGDDLCTILGSGKTVAVFAIKSGQTRISAEYNGQTASCDLIVSAARQFTFDTQTMRIQPGQSKTFKYNLVPDDAPINWMTNSNDYITYNVDEAAKTVTITGISEGTGTNGSITRLTGIANSMSASITITCSWDYTLTLGTTLVKGEPRETFSIPYDVNPADATIGVQISKDVAGYVVDRQNNEIRITPTREGDATLVVSATNPYNGQRFATQSCALNFAYSAVTLTPTLSSKSGSFSRYSAGENVLYLGDGETAALSFSVQEPNVQWEIETVTFNKTNSSSPVYVMDSNTSNNTKVIVHPNDAITHEYLVTDDTYFAFNGMRASIVWEYQYHNGSNFYYVAKVGKTNEGVDVYLLRYDTTTYKVLAATPSGPDGDGDFGTPVTGLSVQTTPYTTPRRVSIAAFKNNTDWYIPPHEYKHSWQSYGSWRHRDGVAPEIYLNRAQLVPILSDSVVNSRAEGVLNITLLRSGKREVFQIPVVVETRNCLFDR